MGTLSASTLLARGLVAQVAGVGRECVGFRALRFRIYRV